MNVQRRPRCTFILPQDVPRGRETVGTTPPPRPAPQKECATPPHSLTRHTTSRHRSDQPLPHSGGSPGGPRPPHHQQPPDPRNQAPPRPRCTAHSGTFCAEGNQFHTKRPRFVTFYTKRHSMHKTSPHITLTHTARSSGCQPARPRRGRLPPTRPRTPPPKDRPHPQETPGQPHRPHTTRTPPYPHHKHHPHEQVPFSRQTSTVLATNKYRSHGEGEGRGGRSRASASSRLLLCPGTPGQQPRSLPL